MEKITTEIEYLEQIAKLKWEKGYKCSKCKHKEYYNIKRNFSRRCKKCGYEESAVLNTMFENSRLSISTIFQILFLMQETLVGFLDLKINSKQWDSDTVFEGENIRNSISSLSQKFGVAENSISLLYQRIHDWIKKLKNANGGTNTIEWTSSLKDKKSIKVYESLAKFLIYESEEGWYTVPSEELMLRLAVIKEYYPYK